MTGVEIKYSYFNPDTPRKKINYSYSKYGGEAFLESYRRSRKNVIRQYIDVNNIELDNESNIPTESIFNAWISILLKSGDLDLGQLNLLLKRFEVTKKIYMEYDHNFRPYDKTGYLNYRLYVLFGLVLTLSYKKYNNLQYLNALLKVNDMTISFGNLLDGSTKLPFQYCLQEEIIYVNGLIERLS